MSTANSTRHHDTAFFKLVHQLLRSHPDKGLVNQVHLAARASSMRGAYVEGAWALMDVLATETLNGGLSQASHD